MAAGSPSDVPGTALPREGKPTVGGAVPEAGACCVQACAVLLHDHTGH